MSQQLWSLLPKKGLSALRKNRLNDDEHDEDDTSIEASAELLSERKDRRGKEEDPEDHWGRDELDESEGEDGEDHDDEQRRRQKRRKTERSSARTVMRRRTPQSLRERTPK